MATPDETHRQRPRDVAIMEAEVPQRLRSERTRQKISVRELARRLEVSPSAISQIETGRTRPSVSLLYAIVTELGMSLDELFQPGEGGAAGPGGPRRDEIVQRADSRVEMQLDTGVRWERLTPTADPDVDFLFVHYPPGSASSRDGLMRHAGVEYGVVLSGRLEVAVGFESRVLEPGDSIRFASTSPHRLSNPGPEPATGVWVVIGRDSADATRATPNGTA